MSDNDEPEIPDAVQSRAPVALTPIAAEVSKAKVREGTTQPGASGKTSISGTAPKNASAAAKAKGKGSAFAWPAEPLRGMKAKEVEEVRGLSYPDAPEMDATLGDRTQKFVDWLFKNHPWDAVVRYYGRSVEPSRGLKITLPKQNPHLSKKAE